ncbi:MAG: hypothetical protein Q9218_003677 [Villophora microphyllina]
MTEAFHQAQSINKAIECSADTCLDLGYLKALDDDVAINIRRLGGHAASSHGELTHWQQVYCTPEDGESKCEAVVRWGIRGWDTVQHMLNELSSMSLALDLQLRAFKEELRNQPATGWRQTIGRLKHKEALKLPSALPQLVSQIDLATEALVIYSNNIFDCLHGLPRSLIKPLPWGLLEMAMQARRGSILLHKIIVDQRQDYSFELDLLGEDLLWDGSMTEKDTKPTFRYRLFIETPKTEAIHSLTIEDIQVDDYMTDIDPRCQIVKHYKHNIRLLRARSEITYLLVNESASGKSRYLRIPPQSSEATIPQSVPETLAQIFQSNTLGPNLPLHSRQTQGLRKRARVALALNLAKTGFLLLGTPWFAYPHSTNVRKVNDPTRQDPYFNLRVQPIDTVAMVADDHNCLVEPAQLFRLGLLLMSIALEEPTELAEVFTFEQWWRPDTNGTQIIENIAHDSRIISKLPLVERAMGVDYCAATAYCLLCSEKWCAPSWRLGVTRPMKYRHEMDRWYKFLENFLEEYYYGVLLR